MESFWRQFLVSGCDGEGDLEGVGGTRRAFSVSMTSTEISCHDGDGCRPAKLKPKSPPAAVFSFSACQLRRMTARCSVQWHLHLVFWKAWCTRPRPSLILSHSWTLRRAWILFTGEFASSSGKGISGFSTIAFRPEFQYWSSSMSSFLFLSPKLRLTFLHSQSTLSGGSSDHLGWQ